ncbi:unnamed protein product [Chondrus crispus]|uniref:Uncharacterized protein n=1 Tax=Chondrus crispus TaxID=2769 RepID=R7QKF7_CHOCR|nr:unnamed protein product [Chondrus crispus]CDF37890.1 unnamed protein product [Chondrus crispus]|eukprot:XP_005717761.1 unnamed protein product [Chondrus crispus]
MLDIGKYLTCFRLSAFRFEGLKTHTKTYISIGIGYHECALQCSLLYWRKDGYLDGSWPSRQGREEFVARYHMPLSENSRFHLSRAS